MNTDTGRLNISLPKRTIESLAQAVPSGGKSHFIAEAIEEKLERERWEAAFARLQALPPTFTEIADPLRWVEELRQEDEARMKELGI
jgi:hypothetical protein